MHLRQRSLPLLLLWIPAAYGQTFEVASIKPNASNDNRVMIGIRPGGGFVATGATAKMLIGQAYDVRPFQIENAPGWTNSDRWDINAKAESTGERIRPEQLRPMLQALLTERFQLEVHTETKEMPVYALVVGKSGAKLKPNSGGQGPMMRMGRGQITATKVPVSFLAQHLSQQLGRKVVDKTGLTGEFDFMLEFTPEPGHGGGGPFGGPTPPDALPSVDTGGPTIFTALQEQLGLKLESERGPVEILVVDKVEKPTEN